MYVKQETEKNDSILYVFWSAPGFLKREGTFLTDIRHFVERHFVYWTISSKRLFVEVSFCRKSTSSKQIFVEYFRRNILCLPGRHIASADPVTMYHVIVRLRTQAKITDLKLTAVSIRVLVLHFVALLFCVHGKHLRSSRDGQLT